MSTGDSMSFKHLLLGITPIKVAVTWCIVVVENLLMVLLPLFIGYAIDGVLEKNDQQLVVFGILLFLLVSLVSYVTATIPVSMAIYG